MFKSLIDSTINSTILLKKHIQLNVSQYLLLGSLKSEYENLNDPTIEDNLYKILNKNNINHYVNQIKDSDKDHVVITYDSNEEYSLHANYVKSIIDNNLKENDLSHKVDSLYFPLTTSYLSRNLSHGSILDNVIKNNKLIMNKDLSEEQIYNNVRHFINNELPFDEVLNEIGKINTDKQIYINKSSSYYLYIDNIDELNLKLFDTFDLKNYIENCFFNIKSILNTLNNYDNMNVAISAGNSDSFEYIDLFGIKNEKNKKIVDNLTLYKSNKIHNEWSLHNQLNEAFFEITKGDFKEMQNLSKELNTILDNKINYAEEDLSYLDKLKKENPNMDIEKFFKLYIKDYILEYQSYIYLRNSKKFINNNLHIVEAYDYQTFLTNYELYKKYNTNIKELDEVFKKLKFSKTNNIVGYNYDDKEELKEFYNKYKDQYPSIFKVSKYSCMCNLEFVDKTDMLKMEPHGHNGLKGKMNGTSFSTPEFLSSFIKDKINLENNHNLSIERV